MGIFWRKSVHQSAEDFGRIGGQHQTRGPRFPGMHDTYSSALRDAQ